MACAPVSAHDAQIRLDVLRFIDDAIRCKGVPQGSEGVFSA